MQGTRNNGTGGNLGGRYPATVKAYNQNARQCTVEVPGLTDGGGDLPIAEIEYPIGDRSGETELKILPGDTVWVAFQGGDPRFPVITGFRCKNAGNGIDWRKFHHANVELSATSEFVINAAVVKINAPSVEINGASLTHNGTNVGDTHKHKDVAKGAATTGVPE